MRSLSRACALVVAVFAAEAVHAQTRLYVRAAAAPGGDGGSWATAFSTIQAGMDAAAPIATGGGLVEVWVGEGLYFPTARANASDPRSAAVRLQTRVALIGGFVGTETALSQRDFRAHPTTISGDLLQNDLPGFQNIADNTYHILESNGVGHAAEVDGFIITGANADVTEQTEGQCFNGCGGGMYNANGASPTVQNCTFIRNFNGRPNGGGAGMFSWFYSSPLVINCAFLGNESVNAGGAVWNLVNSPSVFLNCIFSGNAASVAGAAIDTRLCGTQNGQIPCQSSLDPVYINCSFTNNSASVLGGAMVAGGPQVPAYRNCVFWENHGSGPPGTGNYDWLAIISMAGYGSGQSPLIDRCCIQGWDGSIGGGGGVENFNASPRFVNALGPDGIAGTIDDDLRLQANSPCIDAADNLVLPEDTSDLDVDGNTTEVLPLDFGRLDRMVDDPASPDRGNGSRPYADIGAHEFAPSAAFSIWNAGNGSFHTPANWTPALPDASRWAVIGRDATITMSSDASVDRLSIVQASTSLDTGHRTLTVLSPDSEAVSILGGLGSAEFTIRGGSLLCSNICLGREFGSSGTTLHLQTGAHVQASGTVTVFRGELTVDSGSDLTVDTLLTLGHKGSLHGTGVVNGNVFNNGGGISPNSLAIGELTINGSYSHRSGGELTLGVGGPLQSQNDRLNISGDADLGGGLYVTLVPGFVPLDSFSTQLLSAATRSRNFDIAFFPPLGNNRYFRLTYPRDGSVYLGIGTLGQNIDFGNPVTSTTSTPSAMALGDVNNDGRPDLVLAVPDSNPSNPGSVVILLNGGNGAGGTWNGFIGQITILNNIGRNPQGICVGNFDGVDGSGGGHRAMDIAVTNFGDNTVTIVTNTGLGNLGAFTAWTPFATGPEPVGVAAGRLTGAALDDVVVANSGEDGIAADTATILKNNNSGAGNGMFEHDVMPVGPRPKGVTVANLAEHINGQVDFATSNVGNNSVSVRITNNGNPSTWNGPNMATGGNPTRILAADFDGDSRPELVTIDQADGTLSVLVNTGLGTFAPRVALPVGGTPLSAAALDMDQDDDPDLAVIASGEVKVLRNDVSGGQIAFAPAASPPPGSGTPILVDHADVNTDSSEDLVTITTGTRQTGSSWNVNPNNAGACYPNCDQSTVNPILNANDFTCFLNRFSAQDPYANCDGSTVPPILNANDFTCFLNAYAAGCN